MGTITIQPGQKDRGQEYDALLPLPYPFHIDTETGDVGRQEFWRGQPRRLIGFQRGDVQYVVLTRQDWVLNPHSAVGLRPVFVDDDGGMWSHTGEITEISIHPEEG